MDWDKWGIPVIVAVSVIAIVGVIAVAVNVNSDSGCTATFDQNYDGSENIMTKVGKGDFVESPIVFRDDGQYLEGWYEDKELTQPVSFPFKMDGSKTFYAKWTTEAAAKFFNANYLSSTLSGSAKAESFKYTTGADDVTGMRGAGNFVTSGTQHIVFLRENTYYVLDSVSFDEMFTFPDEGVLNVSSSTSENFNYEFLMVTKGDGNYVCDLYGQFIGPAANITNVMMDTLLIDHKFYKFEENGHLRFLRNYDSDVRIPDGGNCGYYYQIEWMYRMGEKVGFEVNILNDKFEVRNTFKFPANSTHCNCVSLYNGKFLVQYALEYQVGSQERYSFKENGVLYTLKTFILTANASENQEIEFRHVLAGSYDKENSKIDWDKFSSNFKSYTGVYAMTQGRELTDRIYTAIIDEEGNLHDWSFSLASMVYTTIDNTNVDGKYIGMWVFNNKAHYDLIDGTGESFKVLLSDIKIVGEQKGTECKKYFILCKDDDKNIYGINGETVGDWTGKTYLGATNNVIFFSEGGNTYVFRDGQMSSVGTGTDLVIYDSCYMFRESDTDPYDIYAENGTEIVSSSSEYINEYRNFCGKCFIEVKVEEDVFKTFMLTSS